MVGIVFVFVSSTDYLIFSTQSSYSYHYWSAVCKAERGALRKTEHEVGGEVGRKALRKDVRKAGRKVLRKATRKASREDERQAGRKGWVERLGGKALRQAVHGGAQGLRTSLYQCQQQYQYSYSYSYS